MKFPINTNIKQRILSEYDQEELFANYLNIDKKEIRNCVYSRSYKICNPLRNDNNPSLGFQWGYDKLYMKDFGDSSFDFDVFDLVGHIIEEDVASADGFINICKDIESNCEKGNSKIIKIDKEKRKERSIDTKNINEIDVEYRDWAGVDVSFWERQFRIPIDFLESKGVLPVEFAYSEKGRLYSFNSNDPCYCYNDVTVNGIRIRKLYMPQRNRRGKKARFITNNRFPFEFIKDISEGKLLVITKSSKDKLAMEQLTNVHVSFFFPIGGVTFISLLSEGIRIPDVWFYYINNRYEKIICNVDNDKEGNMFAEYHKREYGLDSIIFGKGAFSSIREKDFSDYRKREGDSKSLILINKMITYAKTI